MPINWNAKISLPWFGGGGIGRKASSAGSAAVTGPAAAHRLPMPRSGLGWGAGSGPGLWNLNLSSLMFQAAGGINFRGLAGDITTNSAVAACLYWIVTSWPQAPPVMLREGADGQGEEQIPHLLTDLLRQPSPYYGGKLLFGTLITDWWTRSDAFAYIVSAESKTGLPLELQYLPRGLVTPIGPNDGSGFIDHYDYRPDGRVIPIDPADMLHFRFGMNPRNLREGRSPVLSIDPEVATDNQATVMQYGMLRRGGVGQIVIGPDGKSADGSVADLDEDDEEFIKKQMDEKAQPENIGKPLFMPVGFKMELLSFDPKKLVIGETQRKSEERIAAVFGIPPVVAGLGAGLDRSTFNNYEEARKAAWEDNVIPTQDLFADEMTNKLFSRYPDLATGNSGLTLSWDRSGIRCLQEDQTAKIKDASLAFSKGVIDRWTAKRMIGVTPEEIDKGVYFAPAMGAGDELDPAANPPAALPAKTPPPPTKGGRPAARSGTFRPY